MTTSPLYPTFRKRIDDAVDRIIRQQVTPWSFMTSGPPFRIKTFDGEQIAYEGIRFDGSPQQVFWSRYIEPFLENLCISEITAAVTAARERGVEAQRLLPEVQDLLVEGCHKVYARMADVDRRLRGRGFPQSVELHPIEREISGMSHFIDERTRAELAMWKSMVQPDRDWYTTVSRDRTVTARCPFASVERCPRYYSSLSLLAGNGSTAMDPRDDRCLRIKWEHTDLWPRVDEDSTGTFGNSGIQAHIFTNFCPEITGQRFGWFASSLGRYADEIDTDNAHRLLANEAATGDDYRWAWQTVKPMHYTDCPLYAPLMRGEPMTDYWSMSDEEIELLGDKCNLHPLSRTGPNLEHWYVDRERVIDQLVKRDNALRAGKEAPATNVVNVGQMYGSSIQQGTTGSVAKITFKMNDTRILDVLADLKKLYEYLDPKEPAKQQMAADISTIEAQSSSPHPKPNIVLECLHSVRTILEGAAGNALASGTAGPLAGEVLHRIAALLG